ncbi:hypothetical protein ABDD95_00900 [Mucilaginibacter sp. PAMB04274]|uniref:hypothetical protein n=1 Tax=Mucilaginibacter sp. PAMB04274 TaxID=3138568 RepID=UPI0031F6DC63
MNGTTSQLLSLITHGNYFLTTGQISPDYYPNNVTFKFCNKVDFLHLFTQADGTTAERVIAADPDDWFNLLRQEGCRQLKAYYHPSEGNANGTPDHQLAGFVGGGGTWLIESIYDSYSDFWAARWEVNKQNAPEQKIWSVSYGRTVSQAETINFLPDPVQVRKGLKDILTDIHAFALGHQLINWADIFQRSLNILDGSDPANNWFGSQINENGYEQSALQLMYAAMSAHVFGGMGSWNDLGFETPEDNEAYEKLSFYLYDYINRALISGVNSYKA